VKWWVLWTGWADGAWNMALDEWLLASAQSRPPTLRIYGWRRPTVSLGRHEGWRRVVCANRLTAAGIGLVRRPTGGRAVFHHRELTYSVTAPHRWRSRLGERLEETLECISEALAAALGASGAAVTIRRRQRPVGRQEGLCFESASRLELLAEGRKVIGHAQFRSPLAFLQHGSIPVYASVAPLQKLGPERVPQRAGEVGAVLAAWCGRTLDSCALDVAEAFSRRFEAGLTWVPQSRVDRAAVRSLVHTRYARREWTFRR
jgi:lipoate-protein ligase A